MATDVLVRGTAYSGHLESDDVDLATTPVTFVLDDSAGTRTVWRYRPSGTSSSAFSYSAASGSTPARLTFTLTSTVTATLAAVGAATLTQLYQDAATTQREIGRVELVIQDLPDGAAPVVEA